MKHARHDYQRIQDPAGIIPMDEPVFLLRGKDQAAPAAIEAWAAKATELGAAPAMVDTALRHANAMREWQADRGGQVPDMDEQPQASHGLSLCCQGISAQQTRITAPNMDNLQRFVTKATVVIEPGQPNKMVLECLAGAVFAEAYSIEVMTELDDALAKLPVLVDAYATHWATQDDEEIEQEIAAIVTMVRNAIEEARRIVVAREVERQPELMQDLQRLGEISAEIIAKWAKRGASPASTRAGHGSGSAGCGC